MEGKKKSEAREALDALESPMAYKDASEIIRAIGDTVHVDGLIKPIYNFKAEE